MVKIYLKTRINGKHDKNERKMNEWKSNTNN